MMSLLIKILKGSGNNFKDTPKFKIKANTYIIFIVNYLYLN